MRYRREGGEVPAGPVVVAANHFSHVDPVAVALAVRTPIRFLAVDELFGSSRPFDALTFWLGAIPISRTRVPLGAMRTALAELEAGGSVGVFPEGLRVARWGDSPPKRGAAWLARRVGVPLVPVAISGTGGVMGLHDRRMSRGRVTVTVCDAIRPEDFAEHDDALAAMTAEWERRVGDALALEP